MPNQLEFMDCPNCAKRVATTAKLCRHCGKSPSTSPVPSPSQLRSLSGQLSQQKESDESHMAAEHGGYDTSEDDFDYQQFVADEFDNPEHSAPRKRPWWWFTAWLMILVLIFPLLIQVMSLLRI